MLKVEGLSAYYDSISALKGVSINVPRGKVVSIIGANGAGKSTLLKSISGLIKSQDGRILYKEKDIAGLPANKIVGLGISQVPEGRQLFAHLTVQDNIHLGAYLYFKRKNRHEIDERIENIYQMFPILEKRSKQLAGTLSGGEQQMLAIARALMGKPELLLLDEPSMGLAPLIVREIFDVIKQLNMTGTTILLVEHVMELVMGVSDRIAVLNFGQKFAEGSPSEIQNNQAVQDAYLGKSD